jgi:uncharacterized membrane-anchored protein YitT (DUF2179 family)
MNKEILTKNVKSKLKNIALVIIGTLVLSFGTSVFILPNELIIGGMSGMGIILAGIIPLEVFTPELIITILTWLIFFLGFIVLGRNFALKTLVSTFVYPLGLSLFAIFRSEDFLDGFFVINSASETQLLLSSIFGGIIIGLGCAITFIGGGSTGGTDILGFIVCKLFPKVKSSLAIGIIDGLIVLLGMFFTGSLIRTLIGIFAVVMSTTMIDKVFIGSSRAFVAYIITERSDAVTKEIIDRMNRTTTVLNATGGFSGREQRLVMVSFSIREYSELIALINRTDKNAFVTIHRAHEVNGEGWTR